ncbi:MAG: lysylphosphatidylglycerol synthase transmembrane domain-containing protein [Chloroflexi bacterium]|nr:lysylphosphatidylglycerol synthase transmembrane domain-containing protein [Chloroflexota bacterium]
MSQESEQISLKRRILSLPTILSFGIAIALVIFLATRFDLDWGQMWGNIRSMNPWYYVLGLFLYYISFLFRGLRWRMLAANAALIEGEQRQHPDIKIPGTLKSAQFILIGWFVNTITFLRMGDAYRAYSFSKESKGSFSWSLGTVLAERTLDMVVVSVLVIISVFAVSRSLDSSASRYLLIAAIVLAIGLIALLALMRGYGHRLAQFLPKRFNKAYDQFHLGTLGSMRRALPVLLLLSAIGWILEAARLYFVVQALGLEVSLAMALLVSLGHGILSTVPTPGGVGAVEPGLTGLLLLSFNRHDAASVTLLDRSITLLSVMLFGGLLFLATQIIHARRQFQNPTSPSQPGTSDTSN